MMNICIAYEVNMCSYSQDVDLALGHFLSDTLKLIKIAGADKYCCSGYGIGFYTCGSPCYQMIMSLVKAL